MRQYLFTADKASHYDLPTTMEMVDGNLQLTEEGKSDTGKWHVFTTVGDGIYYDRKFRIGRVEAIRHIPENTNIKVLVSFDGGLTWEINVPDGSSKPSLSNRNIVIPMSNYSIPFQQITASTEHSSGRYAHQAFNGKVEINNSNSATDTWLTADGQKSGWIQMRFEKPKAVRKFSLTARGTHDNVTDLSPKDWKLLGSNDGVNFDILYEKENELPWGRGEIRYYTIDEALVKSYTHYRVDILSNTAGIQHVGVGEIEFYTDICENWYAVDFDSIATVGMTLEQFTNISPEHWRQKEGTNNFVMAIALMTKNSYETPQLREINLIKTFSGLTLKTNFKRSNFARTKTIGHFVSSITPTYRYSNKRFTDFKVNNGHHYDMKKTRTGTAIQSGAKAFYYPSIYLGEDGGGFIPLVTTHFGIKYGIGWIEKPPFQPRYAPSYYHPAIYNGQKENSQPLL